MTYVDVFDKWHCSTVYGSAKFWPIHGSAVSRCVHMAIIIWMSAD